MNLLNIITKIPHNYHQCHFRHFSKVLLVHEKGLEHSLRKMKAHQEHLVIFHLKKKVQHVNNNLEDLKNTFSLRKQ